MRRVGGVKGRLYESDTSNNMENCLLVLTCVEASLRAVIS